MVFSSILFVCIFLPAVYLINLLLPLRVSNAFLLAASLFLYAWGQPIYILLLLGCVAVNYFLALFISKSRAKKALLACTVAVNLAVLGVFKYADFLMGTVNTVFKTALPLPGIALPIGISFFTFQSLSYVVDVYRGVCEPQRSFTRFALYVSFFPQLIAGPIVKYYEIERCLGERKVTIPDSAKGLRRFAVGLGKKVLIANALSLVVDGIYAMGGGWNVPLGWLAACGYALQIYYDFSGYSDMAIGMGRMFGFAIPENFDHPFAASSLRDFWRRWHISLSSWFRDYLYIPLGGNRRGELRAHWNRLIVFFLTGLWHGASWNFVLWGLGHGLLLTLENTGILPVSRLKGRAKWVGILYTFLSVCCLFVLFRADTLPEAGNMLRAMSAGGLRFNAAQRVALADVLTPHSACILAIGAFGASPVPAAFATKWDNGKAGAEIARCVAAVALLACCVMALVAETSNPFIYFRF